MKSYGVTIQMKSLQQYFHIVHFFFFFREMGKFCWIMTLPTPGGETVNKLTQQWIGQQTSISQPNIDI